MPCGAASYIDLIRARADDESGAKKAGHNHPERAAKNSRFLVAKDSFSGSRFDFVRCTITA
jgi:hypothetical protein